MGGAGGIEDRDGAAFVAVAAGVVAVGRSERGYGCGNFLDLSVQGGLVVLNLDDRGDAAGGDTGFGEQRLRRRDFVGFLCDVDMRQHERRVGGERAQHLGCDTIVEAVEAAAQRLAIQGNGARASVAHAACNRAAWRRNTTSTCAGSRRSRMVRTAV